MEETGYASAIARILCLKTQRRVKLRALLGLAGFEHYAAPHDAPANNHCYGQDFYLTMRLSRETAEFPARTIGIACPRVESVVAEDDEFVDREPEGALKNSAPNCGTICLLRLR